MLSLYVRLMNWLNSEEGQSMAEYALILVLVSVAAIIVLTTLGGQITSVFQQITDALGGSAGQ